MAPKMASLAIQRLPRPSHALVTRHVSHVLAVRTSRYPSLTWRSLSSKIGTGSSSQSTTKPDSRSESVPSTTGATTVAAEEANRVAREMFERHKGTVIKRSQILDANQVQKLCITLNRKQLPSGQDMTKGPPAQGTPIPPGYHLVYFTPSDLESELGQDGTDQTFSPPAPFIRRMWSGGHIRWNPENPLRVGDLVTEQTRLLEVAAKTSKTGNSMLLATVEKLFFNDKGFAVGEERSWVFLPPVPRAPRITQDERHGEIEPISSVRDVQNPSLFPTRDLRWSAKALFRFSALTFNAHMVHYNDPYTKGIEGRPGVVVHGPLNLINMMDYWRDVHGQHGKLQPVEVTYRATSPVHANELYQITTLSTGPAGSSAGSGPSDQKSPLLKYELVLSKPERPDAPPVGQKTVDIMRGEIRAAPLWSKPVHEEA